MNHHHIDRRVARSAECRMTGEPPTSPAEIAALVRRARAVHGVVVFLPSDLARMPDVARLIIEGEHTRLCNNGGRL